MVWLPWLHINQNKGCLLHHPTWDTGLAIYDSVEETSYVLHRMGVNSDSSNFTDHVIMLPLFFVHGFLVGWVVFLWWNRWTDLSTNILDAALDLTAACGRLSEDALDSCDSISVSVTVCVHIFQPGRRQGVLLGRQLLVELNEEGQHALADLQDLCHQLRRCAWRNPAC